MIDIPLLQEMEYLHGKNSDENRNIPLILLTL
jgi:hypothetical protein